MYCGIGFEQRFYKLRFARGEFVRERVRDCIGARLRIAMYDDGRATFRQIGRRESGQVTDIEQIVSRKTASLFYNRPRRFNHRALGVEGDQKSGLAQRASRGTPASEKDVQCMRGAPAGVQAIDVRVRLVAYDAVGEAHHLCSDIGVIVETDDDGHLLTHRRAHAPQDLPLCIIEFICNHRTVHVEVDAVHRHPAGQPPHEFAGNPLKRFTGQRATVADVCPQQRYAIVGLAGCRQETDRAKLLSER